MKRGFLLEVFRYGFGSAIVVLLAALVFHPAVGLTLRDNVQVLLQQNAPLPDYGTAPELHEGIWLNTNVPLKLADLRGQVVLLDMWTFG